MCRCSNGGTNIILPQNAGDWAYDKYRHDFAKLIWKIASPKWGGVSILSADGYAGAMGCSLFLNHHLDHHWLWGLRTNRQCSLVCLWRGFARDFL
jgi:hypothetical protein